MRGAARLALVAAAALALPHATGAQSGADPPRASLAPAFSGRYQFVLTLSGGCPASMQVGPLTFAMTLAEATSGSAVEVSGQSASASEVPDDGRFVLLRQGDTVHGAFGSSTLNLGLIAAEGYRVWLQLMTDGNASTHANGRARASGTAFGEVEISLASDPTATAIGNCRFALDHRWALEPS